MNRAAIHVVITLAIALLGTHAFGEENVRVAQPAPRFELKDTAGRVVKSLDFDGKALIIMFFLSGDEPCRKQIPALLELQKEFGSNELAVVGLLLNLPTAPELQAFAREHKIEFPMLLADYKVVQNFGGLDSVPTTFIIDRNYNIIHKYVGCTEKTVFDADLKVILKK